MRIRLNSLQTLPFALTVLSMMNAGCFETPPTGTGSGTESESGAEPETESGSAEGDGDGDTGDGDGDGDGDTGDGDGDSGDGDGDGDSGDGDGDGDSGDGDGDGDSGDGDGDGCMATTEDPSEIGNPCESEMDCGPGYTCQPFNGLVLQQSCQVLCADPCECPDNHSCVPVADKVDMWMQCEANP